jgi:ankyrin repeat protein
MALFFLLFVVPILAVLAVIAVAVAPGFLAVPNRRSDKQPVRLLPAIGLVAAGILALNIVWRGLHMADDGLGVMLVALSLPWAVYLVVRERLRAVPTDAFNAKSTGTSEPLSGDTASTAVRDRPLGGFVAMGYLVLATGFIGWALWNDAQTKRRTCIAGWEKSEACRAYLPPLHDAAYKGDLVEIRRLLDRGEDVNGGIFNDGPPILWALHASQPEVVQELLSRGALLERRTWNQGQPQPSSRTLYPYAVLCGDGALRDLPPPSIKLEQTAELLLASGVDINADIASYGSILSECLKNNRPELAKYLLDHGAGVKSRPSEPGPLYEAIRGKQLALADALLARGATFSDEGYFRALTGGVRVYVQMAAERGFAPDFKGRGEKLTLGFIHALENAMPEAIQVLIDAGASPNVFPRNQDRPLNAVILHSKERGAPSRGGDPAASIRVLLAHGADPTLPDQFNDTAYDKAAKLHPELQAVLEEKPAALDHARRAGR